MFIDAKIFFLFVVTKQFFSCRLFLHGTRIFFLARETISCRKKKILASRKIIKGLSRKVFLAPEITSDSEPYFSQ